MTRLALLLLVALPGCAMLTAAPRAVDADIGGDALRVSFSDGSVCRATLPPEGGSGRFADCPVAASYAASVSARNLLEPVLGPVVSPYAEVTVTVDGGAPVRFVTPQSRRPGFDAGTID